MPRAQYPTFSWSTITLVCLAVAPFTIHAAVGVAEPTDAIFAEYAKPDTPGCAWGYANGNAPPVLRATGVADLEHAVPLAPDSIIEAGSVSKQFTAAAVLLLAADGKLALDDDVRKVVPELPDYGHVITINHLLNHTSGLREWSGLVAASGWPRGERAFTMPDVLHLIARQRSLNHAPGAEYSYTNSGFLLLAMVVERVSGQSLAAFTNTRLFAPLGMAHTSWRDDFNRVVPGRATAYSKRDGTFAQDMPFDKVYGAGALLTTIGDLLTWNAALSAGRIGAGVSEKLAEQAVLGSGRRVRYARGLRVDTYRGQREVAHDGATAGYRAWLARYPERQLSVAILCNNGAVNSEALGHALADTVLGLGPEPAPVAFGAQNASLAGRYINEVTGRPNEVTFVDGAMMVDGVFRLPATGPGHFAVGSIRATFVGEDRLVIEAPDGDRSFRRAEPFTPDVRALSGYAGRYRSEEVDATYRIDVRGDALVSVLEARPQVSHALTPSYPDGFASPNVAVRFVRDRAGKVVALTMGLDRLRALRFDRIEADSSR